MRLALVSFFEATVETSSTTQQKRKRQKIESDAGSTAILLLTVFNLHK